MSQDGFSLTELSITTAITLVLLSTASHQLDLLLQNSQARNDMSTLLSQTNAVRQHAITHSQHAVLCPSYNLKDCVNDWKASKIIFLDLNNNTKRDDNEPIDRKIDAISDKNIRIKYPKIQIRFNAYGIANSYNGTLAYCLNDITKGLVISRLGRIRMAQDLNGDDVPDVNTQTAITCD